MPPSPRSSWPDGFATRSRPPPRGDASHQPRLSSLRPSQLMAVSTTSPPRRLSPPRCHGSAPAAGGRAARCRSAGGRRDQPLPDHRRPPPHAQFSPSPGGRCRPSPLFGVCGDRASGGARAPGLGGARLSARGSARRHGVGAGVDRAGDRPRSASASACGSFWARVIAVKPAPPPAEPPPVASPSPLTVATSPPG